MVEVFRFRIEKSVGLSGDHDLERRRPTTLALFDIRKGIYSGREDTPSLSCPHHLEKAQDITCTMHHLLLSSLVINEKYLFLVIN
jgi:hypothetical protein